MRAGEVRTSPKPLVGRDDECRLVEKLVDGVRSNESRTMVIEGPPGVGKTALLDYAASAARDFRVERAAGVESEMELAFAALHQLCTPMLGRLDRLPTPHREALAIALGLRAGPTPDRFLVGLAVLGLLSQAAADRPLLCVVDDAQWVDRASAQALSFVARRLSAESIGILFATRHVSDELGQLPTVGLRGLDSVAARKLLLAVVSSPLDEGVRDRIIAEMRGNPLALTELPRGLTTMQLAGGFGLMEAAGLTGRIEGTFVRRLGALPEETRRLLLVAAAEPVGDPLLLLRACERLGISVPTLDLDTEGLLELGPRVTFRHPLARSAVYRSATVQERREVHLALAEVTDRASDRDRRAWHLATAAAGPDEAVASELERSACRAQARGGVAAGAAFLQRASALTVDPGQQVERALAAAQASLRAGGFDAALRLVATARDRARHESERARADLLRAQIHFASSRGAMASASLLSAVKRMEPLDERLARDSSLEALCAAMFAARLAGPDCRVSDVAHAVRGSTSAGRPGSAAELLINGWATLFVDGHAAATPDLQDALRQFSGCDVTPDELHLLGPATLAAPVMWDETQWDVLSKRYVELARSSGTLSELPVALNSRSWMLLFRGELDTASSLIEEAQVALEATKACLGPWGAIALAALRGREQDALAVLDDASADATERGEGISLTVIAWARALLYNGLGDYNKAFVAAKQAIDCPSNSAAVAWGMVELIEAAARIGESDAARKAAMRFEAIAKAAGTNWALGVNARSSALLSTGERAEQLYRESLDRLERCQMRVDLARAHLLYGEWLRRENRRVDARVQLRSASDEFASLGLKGFAERAGRELLATGGTARKRVVETRDDLTPQERQIAELASDGLSNPEIGARLFLSRRTVEWHLRHVFAKLEIQSRRELATALSGAAHLAVAV